MILPDCGFYELSLHAEETGKTKMQMKYTMKLITGTIALLAVSCICSCNGLFNRNNGMNFSVRLIEAGYNFATFEINPSDNTHSYYYYAFETDKDIEDDRIFDMSMQYASEAAQGAGLSLEEYLVTETLPGKKMITLKSLSPETGYTLCVFCLENGAISSEINKTGFSTCSEEEYSEPFLVTAESTGDGDIMIIVDPSDENIGEYCILVMKKESFCTDFNEDGYEAALDYISSGDITRYEGKTEIKASSIAELDLSSEYSILVFGISSENEIKTSVISASATL